MGLDQKVLALPDGINTCITKEFSAEGAVFSGGELQKLALARVYAQNFDVIVFDELTSSFDPFAENDIYHMIDQISENKIVIFISHRLINMQHMDKIIYLDHGKIIESGTHRELMEKEGNYSKMYLVQAEKYMQK
ncbi:putative multidrug export ATP-binding/permease protein [bioreactor metagenome]|uniref:Putative multidrug export ATP-binding/permease protein n=1 Tax=bioreactor metagenome TaxID=1076179 RepID=A0A645I5F1_9ZZZZ